MMMDNQSILKKIRMDDQSCHDLLSDLPLGIIHTILAHVSIREAVRTSILSSHWRYIWASLPQLVFDDKCVNSSEESASCETCRLKNFITQALFLHQGPIHKFKLHLSQLESCPQLDQWLLFLCRNDIKELFLGIDDFRGDWLKVHSSLYSCQNLTKLELFHCELRPPPPNFKGFLRLRCLVVHDVSPPLKTIESLVAKCPLLAELSIALYEDVFTNEILHQKISGCSYTKFLGSFINLEKLRGDICFTKYLSIGIESCHHSLVFPHLKVIQLYPVSFQDIKQISVFVRLIMGAPNLHKLKISTSRGITGDDEAEAPHVSLWDSGRAPNFTFEKLRVVKMKDVRGLPPEMEFIRFLLKSSPVLETMSIDHSFTLPSEGIQSLMAELPRYGRASPNAEILIKVPNVV